MAVTQRRVLTVVMDGIGYSSSTFGNAVHYAQKPNLNWLQGISIPHSAETGRYFQTILAHGKSVGLPSDSDIGNSEVGHNALGAGRVFDQGAKLVDQAFADQSIFRSKTWSNIVTRCTSLKKTLHLIGLLSDGNVHSHETHLHHLLRQAKREAITKVRIHVLLDGRDVSEKSAEIYCERLERVIAELRCDTFDVAVASGGGRMSVTMDRYEADWGMVEKGWRAHVEGVAPQSFQSLSQAINTFREDHALTDQYFPPFVIQDNGAPIGKIMSGDAVIFFNFRGDRAIEISRAFTEQNFTKFTRDYFPDVIYAGMMEYDGDLKIPANFLVSPPVINNTLGEHLATMGVRQFACSETQKFGHVTYFWNGNRSGYFNPKIENYIEVPSDLITFEKKPWMKAFEITEATIAKMRNDEFDFGRINFANGDMVGHTGSFEATVIAVETVDLMLGRLIQAARETATILIITADHGNADEMFDGKEKDFPDWLALPLNKRPKPKTAHTLSPVPFMIFDPLGESYISQNIQGACLANCANTILRLLGLKQSRDYLPSLIA